MAQRMQDTYEILPTLALLVVAAGNKDELGGDDELGG